MLKLDYGDRRPIYEQIKDMVKNMIISGVLKSDERIPSVRELAITMAINPNTIKKAYKELENEGYIYSQRAKGYFVSPADYLKNKCKEDVIFENVKASVRELYFLGVKREKIQKTVDEIYFGGNSNDQG